MFCLPMGNKKYYLLYESCRENIKTVATRILEFSKNVANSIYRMGLNKSVRLYLRIIITFIFQFRTFLGNSKCLNIYLTHLVATTADRFNLSDLLPHASVVIVGRLLFIYYILSHPQYCQAIFLFKLNIKQIGQLALFDGIVALNISAIGPDKQVHTDAHMYTVYFN